MSDSTNPYETPPDLGESNVETHGDIDSQLQREKRSMLCLIAGTSLLVGLDAAIFQLGFLVVFAPPILFFCLAYWSVMAGTRTGTMNIAKRTSFSILAGLLAVPCFELLFVISCTPAVEIVGSFWSIHGTVQPTLVQKLLFFIITGFLLAAISFAIYWMTFSRHGQSQTPNHEPKTHSR